MNDYRYELLIEEIDKMAELYHSSKNCDVLVEDLRRILKDMVEEIYDTAEEIYDTVEEKVSGE